ncbi:hypothetical protein LWI28_006998 [Acer negundo]|uniref:Uncharacterized protein n=1 Tax=Acer negundo TaxID=4023 RepID=A0AAD5JIN6_ACENE|nr:hypothetical protein LWI28_006998 [Acer negundo]KAK4859853.1 hypothetical protein QYF36_012993 [Acer negundo]
MTAVGSSRAPIYLPFCLMKHYSHQPLLAASSLHKSPILRSASLKRFEHQSFELELCYTFRSDDFALFVQKSMKFKRKHGDFVQPPNTCSSCLVSKSTSVFG